MRRSNGDTPGAPTVRPSNRPPDGLSGFARTGPHPLSPEVWLHDLFTSKAVQEGAVIRRKARDLERFMREIHRRGYQVVENSGQIIIFCNRAPVRWLTPGDPPISYKEIGSKSFQDFGARDRH